MKGYIAISDDAWCKYLKEIRLEKAVFWRKKTSFKALQEGEYFYFLKRKPIDGVRWIVGKGKYVRWNILSPHKAWNEYNCALGYQNETEFLNSIKAIYKSDDIELVCIVLNNIEFFERPVNLAECGIDFSPYIVSGKTITNDECIKINEKLERSM